MLPERARCRSRITACFGCVLLLIVSAISLSGQQMKSPSTGLPYSKDPSNLSKALDNLRAGRYRADDVELVARMGAAQAAPALRALFKQTKDLEEKQKIAYGLVRLGVADDTYWNYLAMRCTGAINRGAPDPLRYDSNGKVITDKASDAFVVWASKNKLDAKAAFDQVVFVDVGSVVDLAASKDPRAIPLLRRVLSLQSSSLQNCLMEAAAADGLADLHDQRSIPLIISASDKASKDSKDCAATIAKALVYFDDSDAQRAVDLYVPQDTAKIAREHRAKGYGPFD